VNKYEGKPGPDGKKRVGGDLAAIMATAKALEAKAKEYEKQAEEKLKEAVTKTHESHQVHGAVNWIDSGHLAIELALVLCAVSVLTKQRGFWFTGILVGLVGAGLAGVGIYQLLFGHAAHH
jgi:hypothetical protein